MKEATGELNMTVVTVVAIAAVGAFFYAFIWPAIKNNLLAQTYCASAVNCDCQEGQKTCKCYYYENGEFNTLKGPITCDNDANHGREAKKKG